MVKCIWILNHSRQQYQLQKYILSGYNNACLFCEKKHDNSLFLFRDDEEGYIVLKTGTKLTFII